MTLQIEEWTIRLQQKKSKWQTMLSKKKKNGSSAILQHINYCHWFPNCLFYNRLRLSSFPNMPLNRVSCHGIKMFNSWILLSINPPFCLWVMKSLVLLTVEIDINTSYQFSWSSSTNVSVATFALPTILKSKCFLSPFCWYPLPSNAIKWDFLLLWTGKLPCFIFLFFHSHIH